MNMRYTSLSLALLGGLGVLAPSAAHAGVVGIYDPCAPNSDYASAATALGHTTTPVTSLDAASLANLDGLIVQLCAASPAPNAALNSAVSAGLAVIINSRRPTIASSPNLPGAPALVTTNFGETGYCVADVTPVNGSPAQSGPGGILSDSDLDTAFNCAASGMATSASLPAGSIPFVVNATNASEVNSFGYTHGNGSVVFTALQFQGFLTGGVEPKPSYKTLLTNMLGWAMGAASTTTCASEGYTGTKLTWCMNICEKGYEGATLDMWIHRWINRYRDLPYCAQEGGGEEEPPPQEA